MDAHLTSGQIAALRSRTMPPEALLRATRHLGGCATCAAAIRDGIDARQVADSLRAEVTVERRRRPLLWVGLAAAAALVVVFLLFTRQAPTVIPAPASRFAPVVNASLRAGRIDPPAIVAELRGEPGSLRGPLASPGATLLPAGVVIATTQPRFSWTGARGGVVSIYDGRALVATSGPLHESQWTPEKPLARGRTYGWQVDVDHRVIPAPPDPPARFAILDEATWNEVEAAHRAADRLAAAILEARAGLKDDALSDFDAYLAAHPDEGRVRALAASVRAW
jgi:hypothetical protein